MTVKTIAAELIAWGFPIVVMDGKRPRFNPPQSVDPDRADYYHRRFGCGIGIMPHGQGLAVLDIDTPAGLAFADRHDLVSAMQVATRKGFHRWFRLADETERANRLGFNGCDLLINTWGVLVPPCVVDGFEREWLSRCRKDELPILPGKLFQRQVRAKVRRVIEAEGDSFTRALAYVRHPSVAGAISNQGGHCRTFWLCCRILHLFPAMSFEQFVQVIGEFNRKCEPQWSEAELLHKASDAWRITFDNGR